MRKQYHLRPSPTGLLAWDVSGLINLTAALEKIPEIDSPYWFQEFDKAPTCRSIALHSKLIEKADLHFPIILDPDGNVMDGMHRICKALNLGLTTIKAYQLETLPKPDFVGLSPSDLPDDS